MPPSTRDHGVNGLLFDYNLFASTYRPDQGASTENINSYGTSGLNMGAWRLRSDYQISQNRNEKTPKRHGAFRVPIFFALSLLWAPNSHWEKLI